MGRKATFYLFNCLFVVFTAAMLAMTIICRHAPYASSGYVWLLAGWLAPVVFFVNVALLIWWLLRRRWWVALIPLAALVVGWQDMSLLVRMPRCGEPERGDLRVASFNVHGFQHGPSRGFSARCIAGMLSEERVDIACLQEALDDAESPFSEIAKRFSGYMPYYVRELSMACFSRYPILDHQYVRFPESNQSYLRVDVDVDGQPVRFISVHLQTSGVSEARRLFQKVHGSLPSREYLGAVLSRNAAIRAVQVDQIRQVIDTTSIPLIVVGDFNDTPMSRTYRTMGAGLTDAFRHAGHGWGGSFSRMLRIDYIFYDDHFEAVDYYVWRKEALSDHAPVITDLRFVE